ncbi:MAG: bifunctional 4-hydroxy-2-oxoglutarate aldolase/2-dehydro-3-deoxy-phosphogluconate aldolase [Eubacteriales bacterium]|nr:bifunctional 4-hydroxy-2-oxoglutarate aldolase/2-dehydro-3-deoxy-phosphogluconate aldolase [Eubacteriales bacterium]
MDVKERIFKEKLVIIARGIPADKLVLCCEAMLNADVCCLESTFDHLLPDPIADNTAKLKAIRKALGDRICLGVGTTLTVDEVRAARDAGAEYVISPNANPAVIAETKKLGMVSIPGTMTPTEICAAWDAGADIVKLFPADDLGMHYIQNLKGPLPHIPLMATGGVNPATIPVMLSAGISAVGTGVTVLKKELINAGDYQAISDLARLHREAIRLWAKEKAQ